MLVIELVFESGSHRQAEGFAKCPRVGSGRLVRGLSVLTHGIDAYFITATPQSRNKSGNNLCRLEHVTSGQLEVLQQSGFGFIRTPDANYLPGRHLCLAITDTPLRAAHRRHHRGPSPDGEGYFALLKVNTLSFETSEKQKLKSCSA
jgi:hypothetical protein